MAKVLPICRLLEMHAQAVVWHLQSMNFCLRQRRIFGVSVFCILAAAGLEMCWQFECMSRANIQILRRLIDKRIRKWKFLYINVYNVFFFMLSCAFLPWITYAKRRTTMSVCLPITIQRGTSSLELLSNECCDSLWDFVSKGRSASVHRLDTQR